MNAMRKIKRFDVFREISNDFTKSTTTGAMVSIICMIVMAFLILTEFVRFVSVTTTSSMFVQVADVQKGDIDDLRININIDFMAISCSKLSLDAQDVMGSHMMDVTSTIKKTTKKFGRKEGCNIHGFLMVSKVPGNFHISTHSNFEVVSKMIDSQEVLDLSHRINHLSYGLPLNVRDTSVAYSPLDKLERTSPNIYSSRLSQFSTDSLKHTGSYEYYVRVVPTIVKKLGGHTINSYQFSSNSKHFGSSKFPAVYFRYELSPITVQFTESRDSLSSFIVKLLGIVGGIFTGFSLVSTWLNLSIARIMKKANENKLG